MAEEVKPTEDADRQCRPGPANPAASAEERLAESLPPEERAQPDPDLQLSFGRLGAGGITLAAVIAAFIVAVVLYGLNSPGPNAHDVGNPPQTAAAPQAGGAPAGPNAQPANGANHP
jgi:hypothetical protein